MTFSSDHKIVVTTLDLSTLYKLKRVITRDTEGEDRKKKLNYDTTALRKDAEIRLKYHEHIKEIISKEINKTDMNSSQKQYHWQQHMVN